MGTCGRDPELHRAKVAFSKEGDQLLVRIAERHWVLGLDPVSFVADMAEAKAPELPEGEQPPPAIEQQARVLRVGNGHTLHFPSRILAASWDAEKKRLAVVLEDAVLLWAADGNELTRLAGPPTFFWPSRCSPDGTRIATGMRVLDLQTGQVTTLRSDRNAHLGLTWRKGGSEIALGMRDTVERFDPSTGERRGAPLKPNHEDWQVRDVSGDWAFAILVPYGNAFETFHVETRAKEIELTDIATYTEMYADIAAVAASDDGRFLATWHGDLEVRDLEQRTGWSVMLGSARLPQLSVTADRVVALDGDRFRSWSTQTGALEVSLAIPKAGRRAFLRSISHGGDGFLLGTGQVVAFPGGGSLHDAPASTLTDEDGVRNGCWGPDDRYLVLDGGDHVTLHRVDRKQSVHLFQLVTGENVELLVMADDGTFECSDAVADTVWLRDGERLLPASSLPSRRRRGLLAAFHRD